MVFAEWVCNQQKQPPEVFCKFNRKTPVLESIFNKVAGLYVEKEENLRLRVDHQELDYSSQQIRHTDFYGKDIMLTALDRVLQFTQRLFWSIHQLKSWSWLERLIATTKSIGFFPHITSNWPCAIIQSVSALLPMKNEK